VEKRTETSRTYLLANGCLRSEIYETPIHFKDASGAWQEIDTRLTAAAVKGQYTTTATPARLTLSAPGASASLARLEYQGASVGLSLLGVSLKDPIVSGSVAVYEAPAQHLSLIYKSTGQGLKEIISLNSTRAPNTLSFTLSHPGLVMHQDATGQWGLYQLIECPPVFVLGGLTVQDASLDEVGEPAFCPDATMEVTPGKDESTVRITVPKDWLLDPERKFPVRIDPDVTIQGSAQSIDTFVSSLYPNTSYGSLTYLTLGYKDSTTGRSRAFVKFTLPTDLTESYVKTATLTLHQYYQWATGSTEVRAAQMTKDWSESSTLNSIGTGYDLPYAKSIWSGGQGDRDLIFTFTDVVQAWANGEPNYGFCLYTEESDYLHYRKMYSSEYTTELTYRPKLTITYLPMIDVTASPYNATGNDTSEDTAAFTSALAAATNAGGGVIKVPAGDYYLSGLTISSANITLKGTGTSSVLLPTGPDLERMIEIGGSSAASDVTVKDLYLRLPARGDGIRLGAAGGSGITLTGLTLGGGADSATTYGIVGGAGLSDLTLTGNDLTGVTALPLSLPSGAWGTTVSGNRLPYEPYRAESFHGQDRYDTAIRMSEAAYPSGASFAVVVPGNSFVDALSAAPLATAYGGPVLLTPSDGLDARVRAELQRLRPETVFVVGLSTDVWWAVQHALPRSLVTQLTGADRYETAALVAAKIKAKLGTRSKVVIVRDGVDNANGSTLDEFSGLTASALAAKNGWPILLAPQTGTIPLTTYNAYVSVGASSALRVGTTATRSGITVEATIDYPNPAAPDNGALSRLVASYAASHGCSYAHTGLATGQNYPDMLALGAYLGKDGGILLLTAGTTIPTDTATLIQTNYAALDRLDYVALPGLWQLDHASTVWVPGATRHTTYPLGSFAGHTATAVLDRARLEVQSTDLSVASFGPAAALDRYYSSLRTTSGSFAPGWRFGFQRSLDLSAKESGGRIDYLDEAGETYSFLKCGSLWLPQPGFTATLRVDPDNENQWKLTAPAGNTLVFDSAGKLLSEADPNKNTVTYTWNGSTLTQITAANGQKITLSWSGAQLTGAAYTAGGQTRSVSYTAAAPWTVTYLPGQSGLTRSVSYAYTSGRLTAVTAQGYADNDGNGTLEASTETFAYDGVGALTEIRYPNYNSNPDARLLLSYNGRSATITTYGQLYPSTDVTGTAETAITQTFTWNPSGTMATKSNPNAPTELYTYTYTPYTNLLIQETSPASTTKTWTYNNRGNLTAETDELGNVTTYTYPDKDPGIPGTLNLEVSTNADDCFDAGSTLYTTGTYYQAIGHGSAVDKAGWRFTNVKIPEGATITSAQLYVAAYDSPTGNVSLLETKLGLEDADNPGAWAPGSHEPRLATMTTACVQDWRPSTEEWKAGKWVGSPDLAASVQEVIDRPGWKSGNAMCVLWVDDGTPAGNLLNTYDKKCGAGAHLVIHYTRDVDPDPGRDIPKTVTAPNLQETETFLDDQGNLVRLRSQVSATEWAETRYLYGDVTAGTATMHGALLQEAKLLDEDLPAGDHTVTITCTGEHNPATSGTTLGLDAFDVTNGGTTTRHEQTELSPSAYTGAWTTAQLSGTASGGSFAWTNTATNKVTIPFTGTHFTWIGERWNSYGIGAVSVDGRAAVRVDQYTTERSTAQVWQQDLLELGLWVVTDYDTCGYSSTGQPLDVVYRDVDLGDGTGLHDLTVTRTFDAFGNLTSQTDTAGVVTQTNTYDLAGRLTTSTGPCFTATDYSSQPPETETSQLTTHHLYDPWGHETETYTTSPAGTANWTTTRYDAAGSATLVTRLQHPDSIQTHHHHEGRRHGSSPDLPGDLRRRCAFRAHGNLRRHGEAAEGWLRRHCADRGRAVDRGPRDDGRAPRDGTGHAANGCGSAYRDDQRSHDRPFGGSARHSSLQGLQDRPEVGRHALRGHVQGGLHPDTAGRRQDRQRVFRQGREGRRPLEPRREDQEEGAQRHILRCRQR
jgi:YD repeat-containing protein